MSIAASPGEDRHSRPRLRLLLRAGVPSALVFAIFVAVLFWRVSELKAASDQENRADQIVVLAAIQRSDFLRLQSEERAALLTAEASLPERATRIRAVEQRFDTLSTSLTEPKSRVDLARIERSFEAWRAGSDALLRASAAGKRTFSRAELHIERDNNLIRDAGEFLEEQRGKRMMASDANEDAARSAVISSIVGLLILLPLLLLSVLRTLSETQREMRRALLETKARETAERRTFELERQNEHIRDLARIKSEFVTHVSHELRTPLTAVIGLSEVLYDEKAGPINERQKRHVHDILGSARHLLELINEVLDLSQIEAGKITMHPREFDPTAVALDVVDTMRTLAVKKQQRIEVDVGDAPREIVADPARFRQILYNYISNAVKFTPARGAIRVRLARDGSDRYRVDVIDNGAGIESRDLQRLFIDFSQLEKGANRQAGAGLGLAITKRLVELHGGYVGAESTKGTGSVFTAVMPCRPDRLMAAYDAPVAAAASIERVPSIIR